ncbi:putative nonribosomal peptide synthase [Talaromyces proteolyticus]|uniref:Nonribosomal peptide synthase n=1 Tax=Talaromyces proteolyticus TaxID=1131652 RepID=A0AAD4KIV2_9EURO|nr:putative nonribosomal peptide synthase [Talaromyces proteolyticus]KAH8690320.1 putative nonribosomal peptide synthase [Talaromyces proteolyticus]
MFPEDSRNDPMLDRRLFTDSQNEAVNSAPLSDEDIEKIWTWNAVVPTPIQGCVHDLITEIANSQPDAPAVCAWDGNFTYAELDNLANNVAQRLLKMGNSPGSNVPLLFSKCRWTCVAMLGVIKAGCAAIALDPAYPDIRLQSIIKQCRSTTIIASESHVDRIVQMTNVPVLQIDERMRVTANVGEEQDKLGLPVVLPEDIVYISFTSGSTGQPKGACISHANVRSTVYYQGSQLGFHRKSRVFDFAPYSFDVAWSNVLHTLCAGGCLCIASEEDMMRDLSASLIEYKATLINLTPTVLRTIKGIVPSLETILLSGEMPYYDNLKQWADNVKLVNTYGPTECTFKCAFSTLSTSTDEVPSIGKGVGFCTWVVNPDDCNTLVAAGSTGELYLEGPMVGQGYLYDREKTESAFINNPPWLVGGKDGLSGRSGRLYKTGDLVKYRSDGSLVFVGRKETSQWKIRGQRVEIGDVEHHVRACLDGRLSVIVEAVVYRNRSSPSLAMFIQTGGEDMTEVKYLLDGLMQRAAKRLPAFMLPSIYIPIEKIPIGPTGKINRQHLRAMVASQTFNDILQLQSKTISASEYCPPSNEIESRLTELCATVMGLESGRISMTDNFFRLGGDSIIAMQLVASARRRGLLLTVADIFKSPVLRDLSKVSRLETETESEDGMAPFSLLSGKIDLDNICQESARICGVGIGDIEDIYPCTPLQQGMLALTAKHYAKTTLGADYYVSRTAFKLPHDIDLVRLEEAWRATVAEVQILRTRIIDLPTEGLVHIAVNSRVPLHRWTSLNEFWNDSSRTSLGNPLCRVGIYEGQGLFLVLEMHHSIFDGWSFGLILDCVECHYNGTGKNPLSLVPFQKYVRYTLISNTDEAVSFWRNQLIGSEAVVFPPPNYHPLGKLDLTHEVRDLEWPREGITPSSIVRAAVSLLVASYTNSTDVKFGVTVSGRQVSIPGTERITGPTIATVPVRVKFNWDQSVRSLLQLVQQQMVDSVEYEYIGLQNIHQIAADIEDASQFQLLLVVQPDQQTMTILQTKKNNSELDPMTDMVNKESWGDSLAGYNPYAMMIVCQLRESGLDMKINFDCGAIPEKQVQRLLLQTELVLRQLCSRTHSMLGEIEMMTNDDLTDIWRWNKNMKMDPLISISDVIDARATTKPHDTAISSWDTEISYQELKYLSTDYAFQLSENGVNKGSIIALNFEKSAWMIVIMLSVLRIGAVAVPLSIGCSSQRAYQVVETVQPQLAITSGLPEESPFQGMIPVIGISSLQNPTRQEPKHTFQNVTNFPSDPAIVLFTSGSTGNPKPIQWSHEILSSNIQAAIRYFRMVEKSRVFQFSGYDYDVSTIETLASLTVGACLCIPSESDRKNELTSTIKAYEANWICLTPSVAETIEPSDIQSLRTLVFAGEPLQERHAFRWLETVETIYNWYGPAEASVATACIVRREHWKFGLIGRSEVGAMWLVNPNNPDKLASVGSIAELCIEGPIVGCYTGKRGQSLNSKAFLSAKWLRDGHLDIPGRPGPIYRTGDLVKYDKDGDIIYIGRRESYQRKLRGQRVDLQDIEICVQSFLHGKLDVIVVAEIFCPFGSLKEILALFVSATNTAKSQDHTALIKQNLPLQEIEDHLLNCLTSYIIPTVYVPIDEIPVNKSGKMDRKRLREIGSSLTMKELAEMQPSRRKDRKPATNMEFKLQEVWANVLLMEPGSIYATDNFFRLGGDSITAMRLVALLRNQELLLTVGDVFEAPELQKMSERVLQQNSVSQSPETIPFSLIHVHQDTEIETRVTISRAAHLCSVNETLISDMYPCTPLQEGLLALGIKKRGQYVSRSVLPLQGHVEVEKLRQAWISTANKFPILRTRITDLPAHGLLQIVIDSVSYRSGNNIDSYLNDDERDAMGLGTALCRVAIIDRNFILTIHHCLYDGISLEMILQEIESQYFAKPARNNTPFRHFIEYLKSSDTEEAAQFWKRELSRAEFRQFPMVPTVTYQPQATAFLQHKVSLNWSRSGITPSTMIRASWAMLAAQYVGSTDVVFGATVTGRQINMKGIEHCVGPTIATVPVAISIDWSETVAKFLHHVQSQTWETVKYEQYGIQNIQRALGVLDNGVFQTLLVIQPSNAGNSLQKDSPLFKARSFASSLETTGTDPFNTNALMIICQLEHSGVDLRISFDPHIIDRDQMYRIVCQMETILSQITADSSQNMKLSEIQTASDFDLSSFWTQNRQPYEEPSTCVHDLVTSVAIEDPNATAIHSWDGCFSYCQVEELSSTISRRLYQLGVVKGSTVALCLEKSRWVPVLQISVLKAGAVSLLLSATLPDQRVAATLNSLVVRLAIACDSRRGLISQYVHCVTIEELSTDPANLPLCPWSPIKMSDPAAILVSSGSTGEPKQILWTHGALAANVNSHRSNLSLGPTSRVFQFASYDFDVATVETMSALTSRACLCIPSEQERVDELVDTINRLRVNFCTFTRSTAKLLHPNDVQLLSTIVFAGENLIEDDIELWRGHCRIVNWYGPAECSTATFCNVDEPTWRGGVIGHIDSRYSNRLWVVDPGVHSRLVPFGAIGELVFEGPACADRYMNDVELTKKHFFDSPAFPLKGGHINKPGKLVRLYRTGDLARFESNGNLVFLGRRDNQLKINGQLVYPEEVEKHLRLFLNSTGANMEVAVEGVSFESEDQLSLVGFIVSPNNSIEILTKDIDKELRKALPRYAIPLYYISISEMPKTGTGKRDRRKLLDIAASVGRPSPTDTQRWPITTGEKMMAKLWSIVLGVELNNITAHDSFLQMGSSIEAMRLVGLARQEGLKLTVSTIFENPVLMDMAKVLVALDNTMQEDAGPFKLLHRGIDIDMAREQAAALCGIEKGNIEDLLPCTPLQEALLALTAQCDGDYISHNTLKLLQYVDISRFKAAWDRVIQALPILRTRIVDLPGHGLVQAIVKGQQSWVQAKNINDYLQQEVKSPLRLGSSLVRFSLIPNSIEHKKGMGRDTSTQPTFALTLHHSIYDGVTISLIVECLEKFYNNDVTPALSPFQSFVGYICHLDQKLQSKYWEDQFHGLEAMQFPPLPYSQYHPKTDSFCTYTLNDVSWRADNYTPSTIIRAALGILCCQYSNSSDTVFGTVITGRKASIQGLDRVAGPTIATVPIRVNIQKNLNAFEFLGVIQSQEIEMIPHEQTGLSTIRRISSETENACAFQTLLVVQSPEAKLQESGLFVSPSEQRDMTRYYNFTSYALSIICTPEGSNLMVEFCYDSAVEMNNKSIHDFDFLTSRDLNKIWHWNSEVPASVEECVHELISQVAKVVPDNMAICAWDGEISYRELDQLSSQVSYCLVKMGVKRNMIVPLCYEKSLFAMLAVLSVMKTGAGVLLLDPSLPEGRLQTIMDQVKPSFTICSPASEGICSRLFPNPLILGGALKCIEEFIKTNSDVESELLQELPKVFPSDTLYTIFTSGSTGTPKGCIIQHRSFSSAVTHQKTTLQLNHRSRMYDFSSYSFDAVYWSAIHVLTAGGTLCIPSEEERKNNLTESIQRFATTDIFLTPSTAHSVDPTRIPTLQNIYLGGEVVNPSDVRLWARFANVFVVYGPTECSAITLYNRIQSPISQMPSIGRSIGVVTWIVHPSSSDRLTPIGIVGELYLEGPLLGEGYLGDPEKTAQAFVEDPPWLLYGSPDGQSQGRHGRLYKTGDLVKYNPADGSLIFIGRKDTQVKLRGQRIELSEVDYHIRQCLNNRFPLSTLSVITEIVVPKGWNKPTLVAFIQSSEMRETKGFEKYLELELSKRLPLYMIPTIYLSVQHMPLTPSGKVDRIQLRGIGSTAMIEHLDSQVKPDSTSAPLTKRESQLCALWETILEISAYQIGIESNFFRLGGDSICAMRLTALASGEGITLTVKDILMYPRLTDMAKTMILHQTSANNNALTTPFSLLKHPQDQMILIDDISNQSEISEINTSLIQDIFPCTSVQKSLLSMKNAYIARFSIALKDDVCIKDLIDAWEQVRKTRAPILSSMIVNTTSEGLVQVFLKSPIRFQSYDTLDEYFKEEKAKNMGLGTPLTRLAIVGETDSSSKYCILTQHHAIYDGHSLKLLLNEVSNVYAGISDNHHIASFQNFVEYVGNVDENEVKSFWGQEFSELEAMPFPVLPQENYKPKADDMIRRTFTNFTWPKGEVTASTIIRTAWAIITARYTDCNDVIFGAMVTGRQAPLDGLHRMIAPAINVVPVRIKLRAKQTIDELLKQILNQAILTIPYENTDLLNIRRINANTNQGTRFNSLLVVQPEGQTNLVETDEGPFKHPTLTNLNNGFDDFNPNALMLVFQLTSTNEVHLDISFDSHVIGREQMNRIAYQLEHTLRELISCDVAQTLDFLDILSVQDLNEVWRWNSSVPHSVHECVHHMIARTIKRQPDMPAIHSWDGSLTYGEMEVLSSHLASYLVSSGVGPGMTIPLCFEKSMWHPVAALGVMKSGAACVSMDSTQPESRLKSIVKQVNPSFVLSSEKNKTLSERLSDAEVIIVDRNNSAFSEHGSPISVLPTIRPTAVLYIVFTSGSTGVPKGVITTHQNFASASTHQSKILNIKANSRVFDFVSYSFDVSWSNLLQTLICGACLCIPSEWERRNDIPGSLNSMKCDYVYFTPSVANSLDPSAIPGIRTLAMGGEPIQASELFRWEQVETIIGIYGPAECAQALSFARLNGKSQNNYVGHSFGANTWLTIPDCPERLAPIGTIGELLIEGPTVSQGYLNDPIQTNCAYIQTPQWLARGTSGQNGRQAVLYKTGDLLRYNSDGSLTFIGRKDGMVKLRGQRIELAEIEYHVRASLSHPHLCSGIAAEIITPKNLTTSILAIFVSLDFDENHDPDVTVLSRLAQVTDGIDERLASRVPQYMIPGAYIPVNKIPMTITNKTDRRALRQLGDEQTSDNLARPLLDERKYRAPSSAMEKRLQILWSSILGIEARNISTESNFLRIGGESIAAMRLVSMAKGQNLSMTVADIFKAPRLSDLALLVKEGIFQQTLQLDAKFSLIDEDDPHMFLQRFVYPVLGGKFGVVEDVHPCTDFQKCAILDALQDPPGRLPHWIFTLPMDVDFDKLEQACKKLVNNYDILRSIFIEARNRLWMVTLTNLEPEYDIHNIDDDITTAIDTVCKQDLRAPRQFGHSFIRFIVLRHSGGNHRLIFRISHAQFDDFSWGTVLSALSSIYVDDDVPTQPTFAQYLSYRERTKSQSLAYWTSRIRRANYPIWSTSKLPSTLASSDRLVVEETFEMPSLERIQGVSIATIFHSACAIVLSRQFEQENVIFGRLVTGRSMLPGNLNNVVGPCMTELPVIVHIGSNDNVASVALRLQEQFIQDSGYETAGMEDIIRSSNNWPEYTADFGWRTAFQQEDGPSLTFLGSTSEISFYSGDLPSRPRPEVYATPRNGKLDIVFEGNRSLIGEDTVQEFLSRLQIVLGDA